MIIHPHCNPQQLNVSAQLEKVVAEHGYLENTVAEDGYLGLKPGCGENEEKVLQSFPMKERKLLNRNLPCVKQHNYLS